MKTLRVILWAGLCLVAIYLRLVTISPDHKSGSVYHEASADSNSTAIDGVPEKAFRVLDEVRRTGEAPEGYVGGRIFQNREGRLPSDGTYREFDVDPHEGGRNAERIIVEWRTKKAWYTGDHYQTFIPLP